MRQIRYMLIASMCTLLFAPFLLVSSLFAQTRFEWPLPNVDVTRYTSPEECLSASRRVIDNVARADSTWTDTMPVRKDDAFQPLDDVARQTALQCASRFDVKTASFDNWPYLFSVLLYAKRNSSVDSLLDRRLALIRHGTDSASGRLLGSTIDSALALYADARPLRFTVIEQRTRELAAIRHATGTVKANALYRLFNLVHAIESTTVATWSATQFGEFAPQAALECDGSAICLGLLRDAHQRTLDYLSRSALLDSLRRNTASYAAVKQANWTKASRVVNTGPLAIGRQAPAIHANFWFTLQAQTDTVPTPLAQAPLRPQVGTVSLVVFLAHRCRTDGAYRAKANPVSCLMQYAVLRRLASRFPELGITIVTHTEGFYWLLEPPEPKEESALLSRWWQGFHRIPGTLAVTNTTFWRVEDPDRRRINEPTVTEAAYDFDGALKVENTVAVLVDREGVVVDAGRLLDKNSETELGELVDVLIKR